MKVSSGNIFLKRLWVYFHGCQSFYRNFLWVCFFVSNAICFIADFWHACRLMKTIPQNSCWVLTVLCGHLPELCNLEGDLMIDFLRDIDYIMASFWFRILWVCWRTLSWSEYQQPHVAHWFVYHVYHRERLNLKFVEMHFWTVGKYWTCIRYDRSNECFVDHKLVVNGNWIIFSKHTVKQHLLDLFSKA